MSKTRPTAGGNGPGRNAILRQLPAADFSRLRKHLTEERLEFKRTIYEQDGPVKDVYFPESGVISMVALLGDGGIVEVATVGYEGMTGIPAIFGRGRSPVRVLVQIAGHALRMPSAVVLEEQARGGSALIAAIHAYMNFIVAVLAQNTACNRMHTVDSRMARWLLMTHDRVDTDEIPLTQEFMGQMLGVQRPTVNIAGSTLQRAGLIKYSRGRIRISNRAGLESAACECYAHLAKQFALIFGAQDGWRRR